MVLSRFTFTHLISYVQVFRLCECMHTIGLLTDGCELSCGVLGTKALSL